MNGFKSITTRGSKRAAFLAGICMLTGSLLAQAAPPDPEVGRKACKADVLRFCRMHAFSGRPAVRACLIEHQAELAPDCREYLVRATEFEARFHKSCGTEIERYCAAARGNPEQMRACLRRHRDRLGESCSVFLTEINK